MGDTDLTLDPKEALADIRTLARFALQSGNMAAMTRDLEIILTIAEMHAGLREISRGSAASLRGLNLRRRWRPPG